MNIYTNSSEFKFLEEKQMKKLLAILMALAMLFSFAACNKDKDEDERNWALRCARMAKWLCKPMSRDRKR